MSDDDLVIWRRGIDPAAETCEQALRDLMHLPVAAVQRAQLWRFRIAGAGADRSAWRAELQRAACRAGRYVNLNRDACAWVDGPRPYPADGPPGGHAVDVWVRDGDGRDPVALDYFRRTVAGLDDLERGVLWRLVLPEPDATRARRLAEDIAVRRSRHQGLLANPQAQSAVVLSVQPAPDAEGSP